MLNKRLLWHVYPWVLCGLVAALAAGWWLAGSFEGGAARWLWGAVTASLLAWAVAWGISRRVARSLSTLRDAVEQFAEGRLGYKPSPPDSTELAQLAESLGRMAASLDDRLAALLRQNNEQQAVLASMVEGVLAVDTEERVISLNRAASRLLGTSPDEVQGRSLQEVVRNVDLRRFVASALVSKRPIEGDVVLRNARQRVLQAHGTALRDPGGHSIGAVIVLNDVSRLRQLENMRRDFAANVSHELKTPVTSIKGFVETLLDGAMRDSQDSERFLRIIARQADRLDSIIEDLLSLSRIEKEGDAADLVLTLADLRGVLESALHDCDSKASERGIRIALSCDDGLQARINPPLLEQAVTNLLDNAIKYSEPAGEVQLSGQTAGGEVLIVVRDQGCGIAEEHLSRLFERFYRVDKARSRKLGGTGLGLAIVKHIVLAHRGRVTVESAPGAGSSFTIHLPPP